MKSDTREYWVLSCCHAKSACATCVNLHNLIALELIMQFPRSRPKRLNIFGAKVRKLVQFLTFQVVLNYDDGWVLGPSNPFMQITFLDPFFSIFINVFHWNGVERRQNWNPFRSTDHFTTKPAGRYKRNQEIICGCTKKTLSKYSKHKI